jgi:hypothetical protein
MNTGPQIFPFEYEWQQYKQQVNGIATDNSAKLLSYDTCLKEVFVDR